MKVTFRKMEETPKENDIYTEQGLSQKAEGDEISEFEEAFMSGWLSLN